MALEIEKKYRLTKTQRDSVRRRLFDLGAILQGEEFEENTLYSGNGLEVGKSVLRLRRVANGSSLTYKKRLRKAGSIKHQREEETKVEDPKAVNAILVALGFRPALIYEKRRETWVLQNTEIVIDELPFGRYMEIEGKERNIRAIESKLAIANLTAEELTYPQLTLEKGKKTRGVVAARFAQAGRRR
jgi:adenylate cyclase class 2